MRVIMILIYHSNYMVLGKVPISDYLINENLYSYLGMHIGGTGSTNDAAPGNGIKFY